MADILDRMRRLLAALTVVVMATLACGDPLLCPDGCAGEPAQQADTPERALADCLACRHAMTTALPQFDLALSSVIQPGDHDLRQQLPESAPNSVDHPPRAT